MTKHCISFQSFFSTRGAKRADGRANQLRTQENDSGDTRIVQQWDRGGTRVQAPSSGGIPKPKTQNPNSKKIPSSKFQNHADSVWDLRFGILLGFVHPPQ